MSPGEPTLPIRALIIGDSLAAPRPHRGQRLAVTWPALLKQAFPQVDIWQRCRAGAMSNEVLKEFNLFSDSIDAFNLLIIQVGIGDSCPRPYPLWLEQFILTYGFRRLHQRLNSLYPLLLKFRAKPWISRKQFAENLRFIIDTTRQRNPSAIVCVVKIGTPCGGFVQKVKFAVAHAAAYNETLAELCHSYDRDAKVALIEPYECFPPEDLFIADGHHLTQLGHQAVAQSLAIHFRRLLTTTQPIPEPAAELLFT